jgi:hypothetical protein
MARFFYVSRNSFRSEKAIQEAPAEVLEAVLVAHDGGELRVIRKEGDASGKPEMGVEEFQIGRGLVQRGSPPSRDEGRHDRVNGLIYQSDQAAMAPERDGEFVNKGELWLAFGTELVDEALEVKFKSLPGLGREEDGLRSGSMAESILARALFAGGGDGSAGEGAVCAGGEYTTDRGGFHDLLLSSISDARSKSEPDFCKLLEMGQIFKGRS